MVEADLGRLEAARRTAPDRFGETQAAEFPAPTRLGATALGRRTCVKHCLTPARTAAIFARVRRTFRSRALRRYFEAGDAAGLSAPNVSRIGLGRTRAEIARLLGVSRQTLHAILTERAPVTPEMALRLGKLCGNGPELWLALQARYDLERLSKAKRSEIDAIPTLVAE